MRGESKKIPISLEDDESPGRVHITTFQEKDLPALLDMYASFEPKNLALGLPPVTPEVRAKWINNLAHERLNVIAEYEGRIVGHASVIDIPDADYCEFMSFVHQDFRGRGIGTALTEEICRRALCLGKKRIWLVVDRNNIFAIVMFYNCGFRITRVNSDTYEMEMDIESVTDLMCM